MLSKKDIIKKLQSALSNKRYIHTIGVAKEAVSLSEAHGENGERAEIAGLLHDCAKNFPDKLKLRLCKEYHVPLNKAMLAQPDLTHSFLGAEIAKREYGVSDTEILDAIRYHTTGRPQMCALEKIIYLADFFEPNREPFKSMDKIKELAYRSLDEAVAFSLQESIKYLKKKELYIHGLTIEALEYYKSIKEDELGD